MKKLTLIALTFAAIGSTNAQVHFGPEVGLNFSSVSTKTPTLPFGAVDRRTSDMKFGLRVGGVADIGLTNHLYLRPGLFFTQYGWKEDRAGSDAEVTYNYVQLPVNVLYKLGNDGGGRFYFGLLPYVSFAVGGSRDINIQEYDVEIGDNPGRDDLKAVDLGIGLKAGYEFPFDMYLDASFIQGAANVLPGGNDDFKMTNRQFTLGIGYLFGK